MEYSPSYAYFLFLDSYGVYGYIVRYYYKISEWMIYDHCQQIEPLYTKKQIVLGKEDVNILSAENILEEYLNQLKK